MIPAAVVMPVCKRPEFLALSLEKLSQNHDCPDDVRIFADTNSNLNEIEFVRDNFLPRALIFHAEPHISAPSGAWNILHALKAGYESGAERIFLIEEDVMVYPGYFEWSLQQKWPFAACGRLISRHSSDYYTNPGASFCRESLACVVGHINDEFFQDRRGYMDRHFGQMDDASDLDDGLIRRVIRKYAGWVVYPPKPLVAHQGFQYYNKLEIYKNEGTIQERIARLRVMLETVKSTDRYATDFEEYTPGA